MIFLIKLKVKKGKGFGVGSAYNKIDVETMLFHKMNPPSVCGRFKRFLECQI